MAVRLSRIALVSADPERLADFYEAALGFTPSLRGEAEAIQGTAPPDDEGWIASPAARNDGRALRTVSLQLGDEMIDLVGVSPPGAPYPGDVPGWSPLFQHFAIIVSDMEAACDRLRAHSGWRPISEGGPQRLPKSSGGVTAFKFRDPEGHPLEFLAFPDDGVPDLWNRPGASGTCLGIDHSAISVADTERSVRFYETLGYSIATRSHNRGPEQARLDGIAEPDVAVTGLSFPGQAAPHVELLCYHGDFDRSAALPGPDDIAATRLVFAMERTAFEAACARHAERLVSPPLAAGPDGRLAALLRDPDGHLLLLQTQL